MFVGRKFESHMIVTGTYEHMINNCKGVTIAVLPSYQPY